MFRYYKAVFEILVFRFRAMCPRLPGKDSVEQVKSLVEQRRLGEMSRSQK